MPQSSDTWYSIAGHRGLWLRVRPGMPKVWMFRSTVGGKTSKIALGRWPDMDFDAARRAMDDLRQAAAGQNPIQAKRAREQADKDQAAEAARAELLRPSLASVAKRYLGVFVGERRRALGEKRSADEDRRLFWKHIAPLLGTMKLEDLRTKDIAAMRDAVEAPSERRKAIAVLRALLSHAKSDGLIEHNPALGVKAPPSGSRDRVLTDEELRTLWNGLAGPVESIRRPMLDALRLQMLTAQRIGEILALQWRDLDEMQHTWLVPAAIAKNGRENLVPLAPKAYTIIDAQERKSPYVFVGHRITPVTSASYSQVVTRIRAALGMEHFTSHDLRRTAATRLAALGTPPHVVEAILNHAGGTISGVAAIYNRHTYAPEKKRALLQWARELERIASGEPMADNVVAIAPKESGM